MVHSSVKDYLVSSHPSLTRSQFFALQDRLVHRVLAEMCLSYLYRFEKEDSRPESYPLSTLSRTLPSAPYAAIFWARHLEAARLEVSLLLWGESLAMLVRPSCSRNIIRLRYSWDYSRLQRGFANCDEYSKEFCTWTGFLQMSPCILTKNTSGICKDQGCCANSI